MPGPRSHPDFMLPESVTPAPTEPATPPPVLSAGHGVTAGTSWWDRLGGGSLTVSLVVHGILILIALLIVRSFTLPEKEEVNFLPGGGGGGQASGAQALQKKRAAGLNAPQMRTASLATNAAVSLPDLQTTLTDFRTLSAASPAAGGTGGGQGGAAGTGAGGLLGNGFGQGMGPGVGKGFVSIPLIFGQKIDARRMAVVLDISRSMYPFLPTVIKEVDKVAPGSMVILHYGCGLNDQEIRSPGLESTSERDFMKDKIATSLLDTGAGSLDQKEREALLAMVKKRAKTYFVPSTTTGTTWVALLDEKLRDADAIYWFADFADTVNAACMEEVSRILLGRKQKLYLHPSNPDWLVSSDPLAANVAKVEEAIVKPSGGKVLNIALKKDKAAEPPKPATMGRK